MADPQIRTFPNGQQAVQDAEGDWVPYTAAPADNSPGLGESLATHVAAPGLGALIGGKTPAGPIGSAIGAAAGQGYGDVYSMLAHGLPPGGSPPTMAESSAPGERGPWAARWRGLKEGIAGEGMDNARGMGTTAAATLAGETLIPPFMNALGSLRKVLPSGSGILGGTGLGYLMGNPGRGAEIGAALDAAPAVGQAVKWVGTPAESGPLSEVPSYLQKENWADTAQKGANWAKDRAGQAYQGLKDFASRFGVAPEEQLGSPETVKGTVDYAGQRASDLNASGIPWKDAMKKAGGEAGWPLGSSSSTNMRPPVDWPPATADEVLAGMRKSPNTFGTGAPGTEFGPNTVGAAQAKGTRIPSASSSFTKSEFPPGWKEGMTPADFDRLGIQDAEAQSDPSAVDAIRAKISPLLDLLSGKGKP